MDGLQKVLLFLVLTCLGLNARGSEIIHGEKVPERSMQYMVSLQSNGKHLCGGFLIKENFVLTAAHCNSPKPAYVVLGTHNLKRLSNENKRLIIKTHIHERYKHVGNDDIMLLELQPGSAQLDNSVSTISIPKYEINVNENQMCTVAGWGSTEDKNVLFPDELRAVNVSIIGRNSCKTEWLHLSDNVICAGGFKTKKGFCQGDSGGPLVCNGMAVGIVSYNYKAICDYPDRPNVYTDVSKYINWINGVLMKNNSEM